MALELHGTTGVDLIQDGTVVTADLHSDVNSGVAKAWVNFNGTGTVAIRESYNVSSITDNGTGDYTINFTNAMTDANYSTVYTTGDVDGANYWGPIAYTNTQSASGVRVRNNFATGTFYDTSTNNIAVFR